jgi:tetratricopeptide (TPR) repeat protein
VSLTGAGAGTVTDASNGLSPAPPPAQSALLDRARTLVQASQWADAERELRRLVAADDRHSGAWMLLAQVLSGTKRYDDAIAAYEKAGAAGIPRGLVIYNVACMHALAGRSNDAFAALEQAVQLGFAGAQLLTGDADLTSLRGDPRFASLLGAARRRFSPCEFDDRYRGLDFWIGDWDVVNAAGQKIGSNRITAIVGGCAVHELWTAGNGSTGQSLNYIDPVTGQWRQDWVAQVGSVIHYTGEIREGAMHFEGEAIARNGTKTLQRVRLAREPDGRIRQTIETSTDSGKTWAVAFDAWYVRAR